jgi:hypothetical protein
MHAGIGRSGSGHKHGRAGYRYRRAQVRSRYKHGRGIAGSDENGRKRMEKPYFYFCFYIFFAEMGPGSENTGSKTESEYADIRKRTNTDGEPEN